MRSLLVVLALAVASLLAIDIVPTQAAKAPAKRTSGVTITAKDREVMSLRTRGSKTFVKAGGQRVARVYAGAAHFKNARGKWQNIDTRLRRAHGRLLNRTNSFSTSLPLALGEDSVRVRRKENWVEFSLRGAKARGLARGNAVTYPDALPGVDVRYRLTPNAVKEDLVLRSAQSSRPFVFDLNVRKGLRPKLLASKGLVLRDRRNRTRMTIAAPFMSDARGARHRVGLALKNVNGRWRLTMRLSRSWLSKAGRAWPVTVDPAVYPASDADCDMSAASPNTSMCSDQELWVGRIGGSDYQAALRFADVEAAVPAGADIQGGSLVMQQISAQTSTSTKIETRALAEPFTNAASWNSNDGTHRWSEPGGEVDLPEDTELQANATVEFPAYMTNAYNGYRYFNFMRILRDWASGKRANHGLLLKAAAPTNGAKLYSSEASDPNTRPYLHIAYSLRTGDRRGYVHERQQLNDRISLGVNVASGNLNVRQTDFSMPGGLGPAVNVSRSYNSLHEPFESMGDWSLDTGNGFKIYQNAGGAHVAIRFPSGVEAPYWRKNDGSGNYDTPPGYDNKLTRNDSTQTYELTDNASQTKYRFADYTLDGRLTEVEDRNGRKLTMVYSGDDLIRIEDSNNDTGTTTDDVRFTNTSGRITQMTDPAGRTYTYTYANGCITAFTDPENGSSYKTRYEYNGVDSQLSKITTPQGNVTTVEYWDTGDARHGKVKAVTRVTNTSNLTGNRTEFDYTIRPDGSGQARVTDPLGVVSDDENDRVTKYEFDVEGRVTTTIDALGRETSQRLTSNSNVESYTAAGNAGTTPNTTFQYDDQGTDPTLNLLGTKTATHKDGATAPMTTSNLYGQAGSVDSATPGKQYLPTEATNEQGGMTRMKYTPSGDTNGNPSEVAQYTSGGTIVAGVTMQYAPTSIDGKKGQLASITDGRGKRTDYGYDAKGNVNSIDPPGAGANQLGTTAITYDQGLNRISKVTDGKGNKRLLTYDNLGRLKKIEFTGADETLGVTEPKVEYTYDRDGNQTSEVTREEGTGTSRTRSMTYDAVNRLTYELLPSSASNTYTYDAVGNLRSITDSGGTTEYTYDAVNKVRAVYEPGAMKPTKFEHNKDGLRVKTRYPNNVLTSYVYDHASRLSGITSTGPSGTLQDFAYKYAQPSGAGGRQTPLRYETEDKTLGRRTRYGYDGLDRLELAVTKTNTGTADDTGWAAAGAIASYGYTLDGAGNITQRVVGGSGLTANTTNYAYDEANQLCWRSPTSGAAIPPTPCASGTRQTAFDGNGNETTGANGTGRSAGYHVTDQTKSFTIGASTTNLVYLGVGQDRWIQEGAATFQHNVLGVGRRSVGGTDTYLTRDESGTLVSTRTGSSKEYYLHDGLGSVSGKTNASTGALTARYDYEPYGGREMSATGASGSADVAQGEFGYAGGYRSVGGTYHYGQRFYDPSTMRWTQTDPISQSDSLIEGNRYGYAGGDPITGVDPSGLMRVDVDAFPPDADIYLNYSETNKVALGLGVATVGAIWIPEPLASKITATALGISTAYVQYKYNEGYCLKIDFDPVPPFGNPRPGFYKCKK